MTLWAPRLEGLRFRQWDGETVVFDETSAEIHCLDAFATSVLSEIRERPQDKTSLAAHLQLLADDPRTRLDDTIEVLSSLSLIVAQADA